jgi:hypothetical protein
MKDTVYTVGFLMLMTVVLMAVVLMAVVLMTVMLMAVVLANLEESAKFTQI